MPTSSARTAAGLKPRPEIIRAAGFRFVNGTYIDLSTAQDVVFGNLDAADRSKADTDQREDGAEFIEYELRNEHAEE